MQSIHKILLGLDLDSTGDALTEGSRAALAQCRWLTSHTGAAVEALFSTYGRPGLAAEGADQLARRLRICLEADGDAAPQVHVAHDPAWRALCHRRQETKSDLVIVGKRNQSRRDDRKLGSVSTKLIAKCPGPVWVVKPGHEAELSKVLAATDLSTVGDLCVEYAASLIALAQPDAELCVAHAWQVPFALQWNSEHMGPDETVDRMKEIVHSASEEIRSIQGVRALGERCSILTANASPEHTILKAAERTDPDLVVMGVTPRRGLASLMLGNTSEKILSKLDCSLLTVKPSDFDGADS